MNKNFKTFKGTMKVHQYSWKKLDKFKVYFNSLSCFQCSLGSTCTHYNLGKLNYNEIEKIAANKNNNSLTTKTIRSEDSKLKKQKNLDDKQRNEVSRNKMKTAKTKKSLNKKSNEKENIDPSISKLKISSQKRTSRRLMK